MNVVGIDLSLTSTGLVATNSGRIHCVNNIRTKGSRSDTVKDRQKRLFKIANGVVDWVNGDDTDLVVIEAPSYGSKHGSQHDRSGLWWLVVSPLLEDGVPVATVAPQTRAKYGSGAGNSKKDVVFAHVLERYADLMPEGALIENDDIADALLLAAMGSRHYGFPVEAESPPDANLAALTGVLWPPL